MMKLFTFLSFLIFSTNFTLAQDCSLLLRHFDLDGEETVWHSAANNEGHIYICGTLNRSVNQNGSFILKTDTLGNLIWSRVIPGSGNQIFRKVFPTADSGVIAIGISSTYPVNPFFATILVKWDKFGNRQWSKAFNANSSFGDWGLGVIQTSDGGYVLSGNVNSAGFQASAYIIKVSSNGTYEWGRRYAYAEGLEFQGVTEVLDGYIAAGEYLFNSNTSYRPLIIKVNKSNGDVQLIKSFTLPGNVVSSSDLKVRSDGGYFFNGYDLTYSSGFSGEFRQVVIYLDANLNYEKAIRINQLTTLNQDMVNLIPLGDGGFISSSGGKKANDDAHMFRVNKDGQIIWKRRIGGSGGQQLSGSSFFKDSSVVFVGATNINLSSKKDIMLMKLRLGTNTSECGLLESDATSEVLPISNLVFNFSGVFNIPSSLWVNINPAIQEDMHTTTFECKPDCRTPTCGLVVKNFDIGGNERVWSTSVAPDKSVYLGGGTERSSGTQASFVLKTDSAGNPLWSKAIPGSGSQFFTKVLATKDSGVIAVGLSRTIPSSTAGSAIVVKWDKNGVRRWSRSYRTNSNNYDIGLGISEISEGGFLLVGTHNSTGYTAHGFAMRIRDNGDPVWIKHYPYFEGLDMTSVLEVEDGFLISGDYLFNSNTTYGVFIVKINKSNGGIMQTKSWRMPDNSIILHSFLHRNSEGFYLACKQMLDPIPNYFGRMRQIVLHLDHSLNLQRTTAINHINLKNGTVPNISVLKDGSYIGAAGGENLTDDADIYRVSFQGDLFWKTRIGGGGAQNIWSMEYLMDSSFVFVGNSSSTGSKEIFWSRLPIGKSMEGCDLKESDAAVQLLTLPSTGFSFSTPYDGSFSNWVTVNPAIESDGFMLKYSCGNVCAEEGSLPLRIVNFSGNRNLNGSIELWINTANEINVDALQIEFSTNALSFSPFYTFESKGNSFNEYFLSTAKFQSIPGILYFRVKAIDKDGSITYSKILSLKNSELTTSHFTVFPNPSNGNFNIFFNSEENSKGRLRIVDNLGKNVFIKDYNLMRGSNSINLNPGLYLPTGLYNLIFETEGKIFSEKVLIH